MAEQQPWEIEVWCRHKAIACFEAPAHKLPEGGALFEFLKALVVRYRTDTPQEMLLYYVNNRSGEPSRVDGAEVRHAWSPDHRKQGYICGDLECRATAMRELDDQQVEWVREQVEKNNPRGA